MLFTVLLTLLHNLSNLLWHAGYKPLADKDQFLPNTLISHSRHFEMNPVRL